MVHPYHPHESTIGAESTILIYRVGYIPGGLVRLKQSCCCHKNCLLLASAARKDVTVKPPEASWQKSETKD